MSRRSQLRKEQIVRCDNERFLDKKRQTNIPSWTYSTLKHTAPDFEPKVFTDDCVDATEKPTTSNYRTRQFFTHGGDVCSMYNVVFDTKNWWCRIFDPYDCIILLISDECFAGAVYVNGEIVHSKTFHTETLRAKHSRSGQSGQRTGHSDSYRHRTPSRYPGRSPARRSIGRDLRSDINSLLDKWKQFLTQTKIVFVRCNRHHKEDFFDHQDIDGKKAKFKDIPFSTATPSMDEVTRVYEKLTSVVIHGDEKAFLQNLQKKEKNKDMVESSIDSDVRRAEKMRWPTLDAGRKNQIHEAILADDYDLLVAQTSYKDKMEIADYLSTVHDKLDGQTFMHFAVKNNLVETVEFLLDFGCDPSVMDNCERVPYEYCRKLGMQNQFTFFRLNNPDRYSWAKTLIPLLRNWTKIPKQLRS